MGYPLVHLATNVRVPAWSQVDLDYKVSEYRIVWVRNIWFAFGNPSNHKFKFVDPKIWVEGKNTEIFTPNGKLGDFLRESLVGKCTLMIIWVHDDDKHIPPPGIDNEVHVGFSHKTDALTFKMKFAGCISQL